VSQLLGEFYSARVAAKAFIKRGVKGIGVFTDSMASYRLNKVKSTREVEFSRGTLTVYFKKFHRHNMDLPGFVLETLHAHSPRSGLSTAFVSTASRQVSPILPGNIGLLDNRIGNNNSNTMGPYPG
jgi:hypothetical protein